MSLSDCAVRLFAWDVRSESLCFSGFISQSGHGALGAVRSNLYAEVRSDTVPMTPNADVATATTSLPSTRIIAVMAMATSTSRPAQTTISPPISLIPGALSRWAEGAVDGHLNSSLRESVL